MAIQTGRLETAFKKASEKLEEAKDAEIRAKVASLEERVRSGAARQALLKRRLLRLSNVVLHCGGKNRTLAMRAASRARR
eukprot:512868-Rhodomonas_salina.1